jgi:TusA-related sulfurtransferase
MEGKIGLPDKTAHYFLDITDQVCPLTFVRTKLAVEKMSTGEILEVRLNAGEPLANVPRSLVEHGHNVLNVWPEDPDRPGGVHRILVSRR